MKEVKTEELIKRFPSLKECENYKIDGEVCDECLMYECLKEGQTRPRALRLYREVKYGDGDEFGFFELVVSCTLLQHVMSILLAEQAKWN